MKSSSCGGYAYAGAVGEGRAVDGIGHPLPGAGRWTGEADPDRALLVEIARGSQPAMEQFYRRYGARIYRFALARLNDPLAADDIVNDVMLKVWTDAGRFRADAQVSTWVLGIAYHRAMDLLRVKYRQSGEPLDEQLQDSGEPELSTVLVAAEDAQRVQRALQRLSDVHRTVLHLAFFEDLGYDRIAEILGVPEGTVKSRVFHAKQVLKRHLSEPQEKSPVAGAPEVLPGVAEEQELPPGGQIAKSI